jgi:glycosidase
MKFKFTIGFFLIAIFAKAQLLTWTPDFAGDGSAIDIVVDANYGNNGLLGYNPDDVYVHTGVITNLSTNPSNWRYVAFNANFNVPNASLKAESLGNNRWRFRILSNIRAFYGVPGGETILKISILFRSGDGSRVQRNSDGSDMYVPVYPAGLQTRITTPFKQPTFVPEPVPIMATIGQPFPITAKASQSSNMRLLLNGTQVASQNGVSTISASPNLTVAGSQRIIAEAESGGITVRDTIDFFLAAATQTEALPAGVAPNGATYHDGGTAATLVLYAPNKNNIVLLGDFNDWTATLPYQMKRTPDGLRYWIRIEGLTPGTEYAYQYLIDGVLKVADYNAEKILDPWNDPSIPASHYPNLKPYPTGKTTDLVSVLQPGKPVYNWKNNNFQRPDKRNIMAYELLIRDYASPNNFQSVINNIGEIAALGVNTLSLMPFTEFENNNSWGYNPSFMFAVDKFYGPENKLRELIDTCHGRGIAVVLDMVLNHQFGQSPMVRMYWDAVNNKPAANSPWFNPDARHPFNVGYDMNHEAPATIEFTENVMKHWLTKFRLDGFRWDLSKGFTQTNNPNDVNAWSNYDQSRVNIWNRIYDQSQAIAPGCYMILEHLGADNEEAELAKNGMILWGKMSNELSDAAMGFTGSASNFQRAYHTTRWSSFGGNNVPLLMAYAESHDEERLFFRNRRFGNQAGINTPPSFQDPRSVVDAAFRMQQMAAFLFTIPGPKMIWQFGEYGYDASINMCENFTTPGNDGCRLSPKPLITAMPVPFYSATPTNFTFSNYKTISARNSLRDMYARILRLRTASDDQYLNTFTTNNVNFNLNGAFKWQIIQSNDLRIVVVGNFDVFQQSGSVTFPATGVWQLYATNLTGTLSNINGNLTPTQLTVNSQTQQFNNIPAGGFLVFIDRPAVLPITMLSFTAQRMPQFINLIWRTERERNAEGFEIERSMDGLNYEVIGLESARNTIGSTVNDYRFADSDPVALKAPSKIFYRIRMVDKNGEYTYSQVQVVDPMNGGLKTQVFPNPINNSSILSVDLPAAGNYQIRIVNSMGQVVGNVWNGYREKGIQNLLLSQGGFNPASIAAGAYYLRIEGAGIAQTISLIKAN